MSSGCSADGLYVASRDGLSLARFVQAIGANELHVLSDDCAHHAALTDHQFCEGLTLSELSGRPAQDERVSVEAGAAA